MILRVNAHGKESRTVEFTPGFNVVLAERKPESTDKDTRNGLGKTTLLNIIHFCLGSDEKPRKGLRVKQLEGWEFSLDFQLRNKIVSVSRTVDKPGQVKITGQTDCSDWPIKPDFEHRLEQSQYRVSEWNKVLGWGLYGLGIERERYLPSFRSLISYEIRRNQFKDPFLHFPRQFVWDKQVHNAFLLDLNWEHAVRWQVLRDRTNSVKTIRKALKDGNNLIANMLGTVGELEYERDQLQRQTEKTDAELRQFQVHFKYEEIESEADSLTARLHDMANHILQLKRLIEFHRQSVEEAQPAEAIRVSELYEEAGAALPGSVKQHLDDVRAFHLEVTINRRRYLEDEANRLEDELGKAVAEQSELSTKRARLMKFLDSHGALEEYNELQQLNVNQRTSLEEIERHIQRRRTIDTEQSEIKIQQGRLDLDARRDMDERYEIRQAREIFNANTEYLYRLPGAFIVDIDAKTGFDFRIEIKGAESAGISQMKVFCYDLMRAELWSKREARPGFLIHDSSLFADVDERQVARALELAAQKSHEFGFQYIVCLNSDKTPKDGFREGFDFENHICLTLTDTEPSGRLLGIEF